MIPFQMNGSQVFEKDLQRCRRLKEAENVQLQVSCFCLLQFLVCPCEFIEVYFFIIIIPLLSF